MSPTIAGIDLSLAAAGVAVASGAVVGSYLIRTLRSAAQDDAGGWERPARHHRAGRMLAACLPSPVFEAGLLFETVAVCEDRINYGDGKNRGMTAQDLAEYRGVIDYVLYTRGIPIVRVHPSQLKKFATGKGNAGKDAMVAAARDDAGAQYTIEDDNQADAYWLMKLGLYRLRPAVCGVRQTVAREEVIRAVTWPPVLGFASNNRRG